MSDEKPTNPHTGQPIPDDPAPPPRAGGGMSSADPAYEHAAGASTFAEAQKASAAPTQQEIAVRAALETVMDPELGLSVIDLGLIRKVEVAPGMTSVKMMLTTPFCPYAPQMVEDVKQAAMSVVPQVCEVELLADAWDPTMMPDPSLLGYSF
jgi:metal-sulfur cluster biosynthetic enzyme